MKRAIAILLALLMVLSIAACSGGSPTTPTPEPTVEATPEPTPEPTLEPTPEPKATKEDLLAEAEYFTRTEMEDAFHNKAKAKTFIGNTYIFKGKVKTIEEDYAWIEFNIEEDGTVYSWGVNGGIGAHAYFPLEDLVELKPEQILVTVGKVSDVASINGTAIVFEEAFIAQDHFDISGKFQKPSSGSNNADGELKISGATIWHRVYFSDSVKYSDYSKYFDKDIKISAKKIGSEYRDAYIVG